MSPNGRTTELPLVIPLEKEMLLQVKGRTCNGRAARDLRELGCFEPTLGGDVSGFPLQPLSHRTLGAHFPCLQNGIGYTRCLSLGCCENEWIEGE